MKPRLQLLGIVCSAAICGACASAPARVSLEAAPASAPMATVPDTVFPPRKPVTAKRTYFYSRKPYGSESSFNPVSELLNEGFDVLNTRGYSRAVVRSPIDVGFRTLWRSLTNPHEVIRRYGGMKKVIRNELLPLSAEGDGGGAWTGNYGLHLLGSGMVSARMREWYEQHGTPHPELAAHVTMATTHLLNEVIEASRADGYREEALPDLFLFDGLGMLLFHFESVNKLFSNEHVQMTNWPLQPVVVMPDSTLENVGQAFVIKARVPRTKHWSVVASLALSAQGGLSYRFDDGQAITFIAGPKALAFKMLDSVTQKMTITEWGGDFTLAYDRNNSLLAAINLNQKRRTTALNVYPSVVRIGRLSPGFFAQRTETHFRLGIVSNWGFGIGGSRVR